MRKIIPVALVVLMALSGVFSAGCMRYRFCKSDIDGRAEMIAGGVASWLDMTGEQKEKLDRIKGELVAKMKASRGDRDKGFADIMAIVKKEKVAREEVARLVDRREAKMREMKPFLIDKIVEFHAILTPAQRQKIADDMEKFRERCGPR